MRTITYTHVTSKKRITTRVLYKEKNWVILAGGRNTYYSAHSAVIAHWPCKSDSGFKVRTRFICGTYLNSEKIHVCSRCGESAGNKIEFLLKMYKIKL